MLFSGASLFLCLISISHAQVTPAISEALIERNERQSGITPEPSTSLNLDRISGPWSYGLTLYYGGGYDSNPLNIHNSKGSAYAMQNIAATAAYTINDFNTLKLTYTNNGAVYEGTVQSADLFDQTFALKLSHEFDSRKNYATGLIQVSDEPIFTAGRLFSNEVFITPEFIYAWNTKVTATDIAYTYSYVDYTNNIVSPAQNPDASRSKFAISQKLYMAETPLLEMMPFVIKPASFPARGSDIYLGYYNRINDAKGANFEYDSNAITFGLENMQLGDSVVWNVDYTHEWRQYSNRDNTADVIRNDSKNSLRAEFIFSPPAWNEWFKTTNFPTPGIFFRYNLRDDDSNLAKGEVLDHVFTLGVVGKY
jgi:hypothetical protein